MLIDHLSKNREKKKKLVHIIAVFLILIHAFEKYDSGHGSYLFFLLPAWYLYQLPYFIR